MRVAGPDRYADRGAGGALAAVDRRGMTRQEAVRHVPVEAPAVPRRGVYADWLSGGEWRGRTVREWRMWVCHVVTLSTGRRDAPYNSETR